MYIKRTNATIKKQRFNIIITINIII